MRPAIVLLQPRIPQNVGAVGRVCAAARADMHVVRPIPFVLSDANLKRAGMDYLRLVDWKVHDSWEDCLRQLQGRRMLFLTSHGTMNFYDARLALEDVLVFGNEETGFSAELRTQIVGSDYRLPMPEASARCLNLSTAVAVATWELLRQTGELANP